MGCGWRGAGMSGLWMKRSWYGWVVDGEELVWVDCGWRGAGVLM